MKNKLVLLMFAFIGMSANADEKILECNGTWEQEGWNVPPHAKDLVDKDTSKIFLQYLVGNNSITLVSGTPNMKNDTLPLCSKTNATYIYSWDCAVKNPREMAVEWTQEDDASSENSNFHKKWISKPESYYGAKIIYLDRVKLSIIEDQYLLSTTWDDEKLKPTSKVKNYALIDHTRLQCKIAKQKI